MGKYKVHGTRCKQLYMDGFTYKEIEELTGVSSTSLSDWANKDQWAGQRETKRKHTETTAEQIRGLIAQQINACKQTPDFFSAKEADALIKTAKLMEFMGGIDDPVASGVMVMDKFSRFIRARDWPEEKKQACYDGINEFLSEMKDQVY